MMGNMMTVGAALGGLPKGVPLDPSKAPPPMVVSDPFVGTPDEVVAKIAKVHGVLGMGRLEVSVGAINPIEHEMTMRCLKLVGETMIDSIHAEAF
jgi:hypothetical protein